MSSKPKKRMNYPPGCGINRNPVGTAVEFAKPIAGQDQWLLYVKMAIHSGMTELLAGRATRQHLRDVVSCYNMSRSLLLAGFGPEYHDVILNAADSIEAIAKRYTTRGKYVLSGPEINALNSLIELHDAQMELVTVGDVEKAIASAREEFNSGKCLRLPHTYIGDKEIA